MKATDFNFTKDLQFNLDKGITTFHNNRLVILDAGALGLLRQHLIKEIGMDRTRAVFLRFGYQNGYSDFLQMKLNYKFDSEEDLLASGPVIHTWEGIVHAKPTKIMFDREKGKFFFTGIWSNSYEAEQHLMHNNFSDEPVCWSLMGYASGWCSGFFGSPVLAIEPKCKGKGDEHCEWLIKPVGEWDKEADPYKEALKQFIGG